MELSEPMGISLYEKLRGAAVANGFRDHLDAPFLLTLDFIGMDTQGKTHKEIPRRYFPIKIVNSEMDMGAGGTMYTVTAVPWTEFGMVNRYLYLRGTATIKGFSITEALKSLETIIKSHQRKEKPKTKTTKKEQTFKEGQHLQSNITCVSVFDVNLKLFRSLMFVFCCELFGLSLVLGSGGAVKMVRVFLETFGNNYK